MATDNAPETPAQPPSLADKTAKPKPPKQPRPKGVKTNKAELELRHHTVAQWAASGLKKWQAKQKANELWGIGPRGFEDYWTEANRIRLTFIDKTPEEEYRESCAYYDAVMANPATPELGLEARKAKDKLTGIQRPRRHAMTGADGEVINPVSNETVVNLSIAVNQCSISNMSTENLRKMVEIRKVLQSIVGQGEGSGAVQHGDGRP